MPPPPRPRPRRRRPPPQSLPSPLQILTQILTLQLLYYAGVTGLLLFTALTSGLTTDPPLLSSADLVLSWRSVRGDTARGWTLGACWVLGGVGVGYVSI